MDIGIDSYMRDGIPPGALLNFSALLGWSPANFSNKGVMSLDDMVKNVSHPNIHELEALEPAIDILYSLG